MLGLLKNTYLLNVDGVKADIERLWGRYQDVLDDPKRTWGDMNEARAILYFLGRIFCEGFAAESLEKRVGWLEPETSLAEFLSEIDAGKDAGTRYSDRVFYEKLRSFYLAVKNIKNRVNRDGTYLDEATFDKLYSEFKPDGFK